MADKEVTYEVLAGEGSRWVIDSIHRSQSVAMTRAQALLDTNLHDGVKVSRENGRSTPEIVFQQECEKKAEKPVTISPISEAAVCSGIDDLAGFEARKTTGRLLRKYLDERKITALELLNDYGHLRELKRTEKLFDQAIHRVSSIQARVLDEKAGQRIDLLYRMSVELVDWARDAKGAADHVAILTEQGLTAALQAIADSVGPNARSFAVSAMLAGYLGQERDWTRKLLLVFDLLDKQPDDEALVYLDELCAEIMDGSEAVHELLGSQLNLGASLRAMAQLSIGRYESASDSAPAGRFNRMMFRHAMPVTRDILLERIVRAASGVQPLTRESDEADRAVFPALLEDLIGHGGLLGGVGMSAALTRRARIAMKRGDEDLSPEEGVECILAVLPNKAVQIGYLMDLVASDFGAKYQSTVLKALLAVVESLTSLDELLPPGSSRDDIFAAVNDLHPRIGDDALGEEIGVLIARRLEKVLRESSAGARAGKVLAAAEKPKAPKKKAKIGENNRVYRAGHTIFKEGDPGDEAFMIASGEVRISTLSGDREIVLAVLGRGEIFGEMSLIDDQPRMATATATADTALSAVPQEAFQKRLSWLAEEDRMISHLLQIFVDRLRQRSLV